MKTPLRIATALAVAVTLAAGAAPTAQAAPTAPGTSGASRPIVSTRTAAFTTPSGNITCLMTAGRTGHTSVVCDIADHTWRIKPPWDCVMDYGNGLVLDGARRASILCTADSIYGTSAIGHPKTSWYRPKRDAVVHLYGMRLAGLRYGSSLKVGDSTCTSTTTGVTCTNTARHGFTLARATFRTW